jgi:hypothetical protein
MPLATLAGDAAELAEMAGVTLTDAHRSLLADSLVTGPDARWVNLELTVTDAEDLLLARELAGLFLLGERILVACRGFAARRGAFCHAADAVTSADELSRRVRRVSRANGAERIEMASGARLQFSSAAGARGYAADLVVMNGDQASLDRMRPVLLPCAASRPNPQVWYHLHPVIRNGNGRSC